MNVRVNVFLQFHTVTMLVLHPKTQVRWKANAIWRCDKNSIVGAGTMA